MNFSKFLYKTTSVMGLIGATFLPNYAQVNVTATGGTLNATYPTIAAAVTAINAGTHTGTITTNINAGHTETAPVGGIALTATGTAGNTITFQKSGAGANPVITAYTGGTGTPGAAAQDGIFRLVGSDFVTIDGIDLSENAANTANPATMEYGYALYKASATDGCQNNTIRNCTVTLNRINNAAGTSPMFDGSIGILLINSIPTAAATALTITAATGASSNNTFQRNTIQNCNIGIALSGFAAASPFTLADFNNVVGGSATNGNTIINYGGGATTSPAAGIRINSQWSANLSFNSINNNNGTGVSHATTLRGILTGTAVSANITISNNSITLTSAGTTSQLDGINNAIGSTPASNNVNISNNTISLNYSSATGATINGITNTGNGATITVSSNTITAPSLGGTGTHLMISAGGAAGSTLTANNNTVSNVVRTSATTGALRGIVIISPDAATVSGNLVENMSYSNTASTGTIDGIFSTNSVINITISNNILRNFSTPTTGTIKGILEFGITGVKIIQNNTIANFSTTVGGTGGTSMTGIQYAAGGTMTMASNQISALNSTGGTAGVIYGISVSTGSITNIFNNKITDLSSTSTGPVVAGLFITGGTTHNVFNNIIGDLRTPAANAANPLIGINITSSTNTNLYYNTVRLSGASTGALFGSSAVSAVTSTNLTMNNNIFVNTSTTAGAGLAVAYRRSSTTLTSYQTSSNRNDFFASTIYTDGTTPQATLAGYQTAMGTRDANSISENPPFLSLVTTNANYLHIDPAIATGVESGGVNIAGITNDFDGDIRFGNAGYTGTGFAPDMGADEMNGISNLPACSGAPAAANALSSVTSTCASQVFSLSLSTAYSFTGITYQWQSSPDGVTYTNISGATAATTTATQTSATFYRAIVTCANSGQSITATPVSVAQNTRFFCYCAATYASGPASNDEITRVRLNTLDNTSGASTSPFYTFFNTVTIPTITQNTTETISITFGSHTAQFTGVWIDYNQDGDFNDGGEFIAFNTVTAGSSGTAALTFTVPAGALLGQTMMRVRGGEDVQLTNAPCGASGGLIGHTYGETEDYIVNITAATACFGVPAAANSVSSVTAACPSQVINLSLSTNYTLTGITYQWQSSPDGITYTNISGATASTATATQSSATFYRAIVTCANSAQSITATPVSVAANTRFFCYCATTYGSGPGTTDQITRVRLNTLDNTSGASASPFYTFFNTVTIPTITQNATENISITMGSDVNQFTGVWIDYNQDGDFADAGEFVTFNTVSTGANGTAVLAFTVPAGALLGQTMMRVRGGEDTQLANTPCGASSSIYGETEDYIISVVAPTPCSGAPAAANTIASVTAACPSQVINLSLSTTYSTAGISYQWQSSPDGITYTNISGATATSTTATQSSATFYRAIITCANSGQSTTATPASVAQNTRFFCYCAPTYGSGPNPFGGNTDAITNVTLGTLNNSSLSSAIPYYTFFNTVTVPSLAQNSTQTVSVTMGSDPNQFAAVWIDFNQDGDFDDANEFVNFNTINAGANGTTVLTFTVPSTAIIGQTMMRVRGGNDSQLTNTPCGASSSIYGETEDYIVNIICVSPTLASTVTNVSCAGGNNGSIAITATNGITPYMYMWSNSQTGATATGLTAGTYTVTVTETGTCFTTLTAVVIAPTALAATATVTSNYNGAQVSCFSAADGQATVTASGATAPYMYMWSAGMQTTAIATGLVAGAYTITTTDANGCSVTRSVTVTQPTAVTATITAQTNVLCNGAATGSATATGTGGTGTSMFMWSNGQTTATATGLTAGIYTVTTTDINGCMAMATTTISQPAAALAISATPTNVLCFGGNNGAVTTTATGGTGAYTYLWTGGATTANRTGLTAGTYSVTVTDANGCMAMTSAAVGQPAAALTATNTPTNITCFGSNNGIITVNATGGTTAYTFNRGTGAQGSNVFNGLAVGSYTITVTDANGCSTTTAANITQPAAALSLTVTATGAGCGGSVGSATATTTGGTAGYSFLWTGNRTGATITGLTAGAYAVTVTDANGCIITGNANVTATVSPVTITASQTNVLCFGGNTGAINATPANGATPYSFAWSNGRTVANNTGLAAGVYTLTVTDANSCMAMGSYTISQPAAALTASSTQTNVACFGGNNGTITASAVGGTAPYMFMWAGGITTAARTGLTAGTYTVTVTDNNGCMTMTSATITQPAAALTANATATTVSCFGGNDGTATVTTTGGTGAVMFMWSNTQTTATATGLVANTYTVTATDANGCTTTATAAVTQPTAALTTTPASTSPSCIGDVDGMIMANATGGTAPYMFMWSDAQTTAAATGLSAGVYQVTVTDSRACVTNATITLSDPAAITLTVTSADVLCNGDATGMAMATTAGGTGVFNYAWSDGQTTAAATGLTIGVYTISVRDANSCTETASVTISEPTAIGINTSSTDATACGAADGTGLVVATGGTTPYTYAWSNGQTTDNLSNVGFGVYTVTVTDDNGCMKDGAVTISEPSGVNVSATATDVLCFNTNTGTGTAVANGGSAPYMYAWSDGQMTDVATGLVAGAYSVTATDNAGCRAFTNVTVTEATPITLSVSSTDATCGACTDGSAMAQVLGGVAPYTFAWSNGTTSALNIGLAVGAYTVTITDANGCTANSSVTVSLFVSIDNNTVEAVKLYPNPTSATITIENLPVNARVQVINSLGQTLRSYEPNQPIMQMDMTEFSPATYYIQIIADKRAQIIPVVRIR